MGDCEKVELFDHVFFQVVDNKSNVVKDNDPTYNYWSGIDGTNPCPRYEHQSETSKEIYWICTSVYIALRLAINFIHIRIVIFRIRRDRKILKESRRKSKSSHNKRRRRKRRLCFGVPFTTLFEFLHTILVVIAAISFGVSQNMSPINAYIIFSVAVSSFILSMVFSCLKMIHLGQRLLPRSVRGREGDLDNHVHHDWLLLLLLCIMILCEVVAPFLCLVVASFTRDTTFAALSFGVHGIAVQMGTLIIIRQSYRLIHYIKASKEPSKPIYHLDGNLSMASGYGIPEEPDQIDKVVSRMRNRSIIIFICGTPPVVLLILTGFGIVPMYWYIAFVFAFGSSISSFASTIMFLPHGMHLLSCKCDVPTRDEDRGGSLDDVVSENNSKAKSGQSKNIVTLVSPPSSFVA